jgi:hypothetical protein
MHGKRHKGHSATVKFTAHSSTAAQQHRNSWCMVCDVLRVLLCAYVCIAVYISQTKPNPKYECYCCSCRCVCAPSLCALCYILCVLSECYVHVCVLLSELYCVCMFLLCACMCAADQNELSTVVQITHTTHATHRSQHHIQYKQCLKHKKTKKTYTPAANKEQHTEQSILTPVRTNTYTYISTHTEREREEGRAKHISIRTE